MRGLWAFLVHLLVLSSQNRETDGNLHLSNVNRHTTMKLHQPSLSRDIHGKPHMSEVNTNTDINNHVSSVDKSTGGSILSNLADVKDGNKYQPRNTTVTLGPPEGCTDKQVRLDNSDLVELTPLGSHVEDTPTPGGATCVAHFVTAGPHQGICVHNKGEFFISADSGLELRFYTSWLGPDKIFDWAHHNLTTWCTESSLVSVELKATRHVIVHDTDIRFSFLLTNVTIETINKQYGMDTFKHCPRDVTINPGETIHIIGHESPVTGDLPSSCQIQVLTGSGDDSQVLCLRVEGFSLGQRCQSRLLISGFDSRFRPETLLLDCNNPQPDLTSVPEMCSKAKTLTLTLTRHSPSDTGFNFAISVKAKQHPHWQAISDQVTGRRWMDFVKAVTYFIAIIDSLAGISAAVLASMIRRPRSFWKCWALSLNPVETCSALNYEVTFPEVSCSNMEAVDDVKS